MRKFGQKTEMLVGEVGWSGVVRGVDLLRLRRKVGRVCEGGGPSEGTEGRRTVGNRSTGRVVCHPSLRRRTYRVRGWFPVQTLLSRVPSKCDSGGGKTSRGLCITVTSSLSFFGLDVWTTDRSTFSIKSLSVYYCFFHLNSEGLVSGLVGKDS